MATFCGKVVLITGASSGIGAEIAVHFAKLGATLSLTGRNRDGLQQVSAACVQQGLSADKVMTIPGDINSGDDRQAIIQRTVDNYGCLDILVNNAGIAHFTTIGEITPEMYDEQMDTNCRSQIFLTQLAIPHLVRSKGNIVNNSSIAGSRSNPAIGAYCVSKAALDMFTKCLALELAPRGVRVNAISPGAIISNITRRSTGPNQNDAVYAKFMERQALLHPLGRVGQPDDCAEAVAFLASDAASFITGQILFIDGGRHCLTPGVATDLKKE